MTVQQYKAFVLRTLLEMATDDGPCEDVFLKRTSREEVRKKFGEEPDGDYNEMDGEVFDLLEFLAEGYASVTPESPNVTIDLYESQMNVYNEEASNG